MRGNGRGSRYADKAGKNYTYVSVGYTLSWCAECWFVTIAIERCVCELISSNRVHQVRIRLCQEPPCTASLRPTRPKSRSDEMRLKNNANNDYYCTYISYIYISSYISYPRTNEFVRTKVITTFIRNHIIR